MPRLKQRRSNIQYGGTKVSIRELKDNSSFTPCYDEEKIGRSLLDNTKSINLITDSSVGSCLFYGELVDDKDSLVLLESQTISRDGSSPLPLTDAKHVPENVGKGMRCQKYCMKVMLFDPRNTDGMTQHLQYSEKRFKEITNNLTVKKEKEKQKKIYETSICFSGTDGEIVPDGIASIVLTPVDFKFFFEKHLESKVTATAAATKAAATAAATKAAATAAAAVTAVRELSVYNWIFENASKNNLLVCVYFMDYLDGFITLNELKKDLQGITIYEVSNDIAAYILYILYITKEWSYDMHNGNIMILIKTMLSKTMLSKTMLSKRYMLRFIDFGRTRNFGDHEDNNYIQEKFEKFLNMIHSELMNVSKQKPKNVNYETGLLDYLDDLHLFFGVDPPKQKKSYYDQTKYKDTLTQMFNEYLQKLSLFDLTILHDDTKIEEGKKYLFECLMFLSFVELIILYIDYGQDILQCSIIENIFMMKKQTNISMFLQNNRLKYDKYLLKNTDAKNSQINNNFSSIHDKLKQLTSSCSRSSTEDFRGITRENAIKASKGVLEQSIESAVDASEKEKQNKEKYVKMQKDYERYYQEKDSAEAKKFWFVGGSSTRKRKYRSRRFHNRRKSRKYRRRRTIRK